MSDDCPLAERLAYERAIFREYQWAPWRDYRPKRTEFLCGWAERFPQHRRGVDECIQLLDALQPRIAVYPGSFQPFHLGHLSILQRAEQAFDKIIIALGVNRQKLRAVDSMDQRHAALQSQLGVPSFACTPDLFPDLMAAAIQRRDITQWAATQDIKVERSQ